MKTYHCTIGTPAEVMLQASTFLLEDTFDRVIKSTEDRNLALIRIMKAEEGLREFVQDFKYFSRKQKQTESRANSLNQMYGQNREN